MVAKGIFLESLESYIIADRLGHLPTPVMKDLLMHYQSSCMMESLERCIVHLDITSLDIQQVCIEEQIRVLTKYNSPLKVCAFEGGSSVLGEPTLRCGDLRFQSWHE